MSLVGPRPLPNRDVTRFNEAWLMRRFSVKPGLTCLWQINGRSNTSFDQWIALDLNISIAGPHAGSKHFGSHDPRCRTGKRSTLSEVPFLVVMNIVILTDFAYVNGGASKIALGSAKELAASGEKVFLLAAVGPIAPELHSIPGLTPICAEQFEILVDPNRLRAVVQGFWNRKASRLMSDVLERLNPSETVVHVHLWAKALSSSVVRAAVKRGFHVAMTIHDYLAVCPNGTLFDHPKQQLCALQPMSLRCLTRNCDSRRYSHKLWQFGREVIQMSAGLLPTGIQHFISVSELSENVLRPYLPAEAHLHRVNNFVETKKEAPVDVMNHSTFVYAGRLAHEKGVLLWAECARRLNERALFIGDGDLRAAMDSRYAEMEITGWLNSTDTRTHMRRTRALVFLLCGTRPKG